jgi:hypothetical protein
VETEAVANSEEQGKGLSDIDIDSAKYMAMIFVAIRHMNAKYPVNDVNISPPFSVCTDGSIFGVMFIRDVIWDSRKEPIAFEPEDTFGRRFIDHISKNVMMNFIKTAVDFVKENPDDSFAAHIREVVARAQEEVTVTNE